jgi:hypothetical protein
VSRTFRGRRVGRQAERVHEEERHQALYRYPSPIWVLGNDPIVIFIAEQISLLDSLELFSLVFLVLKVELRPENLLASAARRVALRPRDIKLKEAIPLEWGGVSEVLG